jgi:glycosyltransferase involved in cell wall biosynthesis
MIAINASNAIKGGGRQVTIWFVCESLKTQKDCFYILHRSILDEIQEMGYGTPLKSLIVEKSPAKSLQTRTTINQTIKRQNIKLVFSVFGPAYLEVSCFHLMGFANGWITHSHLKTLIKTYGYRPVKIILDIFRYIYYAYWVRKANAWILETEVSKKGLVKRLCVDPLQTDVVLNSFNSMYMGISHENKKNKEYKILYLAADYPHKNHLVLVKTAKILKSKKINVKFVISIPNYQDSYIKRMVDQYSVFEYFVNVGYVSVKNCPDLYNSVDACVMPSLLETFSANYPEAMVMKKPLLVSDFDFSRDICGDAALYFNADDPKEIVSKILLLMESDFLKEDLIEKGLERLKKFPVPEQRFKAYWEIINKYNNEIVD